MSDTDKPFRMRTFDLATENERYLYVECVNDKGRIAELEEELNRYRHGYRGGCYACEQVAQLNIKLEAQLASAKQADHTELVSRLEDIVDVYGYNLIREIDEAIRDAIAALKKESTP